MARNGASRWRQAPGRANDWSLLKGDAFKPAWPQDTDLNGNAWQNQAVFAWSDLNDDA